MEGRGLGLWASRGGAREGGRGLSGRGGARHGSDERK